MKAVFAAILLVLLCFPVLTNAQAGVACSTDDLAAQRPGLLQALGSAQTQLTAGDVDATVSTLTELKAQIAEVEAGCRGLSFSGTGNTVAGPFDLPAGVYRVHAEIDTFGYVTLEQLSGDCGIPLARETDIILNTGTTGGSADGMVRSKGCRAALQLNASGGAWS